MTEKQQTILAYLYRHTEGCSYFKSRRIARDIDLSPKEVGTNMLTIMEGDHSLDVEKWAYSTSTTWKVTNRCDLQPPS